MAKSGRAVLVTGGTGLLGSAIVRRLAAAGYRVALTSRKAERARSLVGEFPPRMRSRIEVIPVDLEDAGAITAVLRGLARARMLPIGLVNAARNRKHLIPARGGDVSRRSWVGEFKLDVVVAHELSMALADTPRSGLRSIVNVSSIYGVVAPAARLYRGGDRRPPVHYGVAKAALIQLSRDLAVRLAPRGVRVNAVSFGGVASPANSAEFKRHYAELCPAGRMLNAEEVPGVVEFLLSDDASGITGHNLLVDGGWTAW